MAFNREKYMKEYNRKYINELREHGFIYRSFVVHESHIGLVNSYVAELTKQLKAGTYKVSGSVE